jgi:hypothetical protein
MSFCVFFNFFVFVSAEIDMRFGLWNVRSLYKAVSRDLSAGSQMRWRWH